MHEILASATFAKQFRALPRATQGRIRAGLDTLRDDPLTPRTGADIKLLRATDPPKHRFRVASYRIVYLIEGRRVKPIEVFARARGYRE